MLHSFVLIFLIALPTAFSLPLTEYDQPANLGEHFDKQLFNDESILKNNPNKS